MKAAILRPYLKNAARSPLMLCLALPLFLQCATMGQIAFGSFRQIYPPPGSQTTDQSIIGLVTSPDTNDVVKIVRRETNGPEQELVTVAEMRDTFGFGFTGLNDVRVDSVTHAINFTGLIGFIPIGIYRFDADALHQLVEPDSPIQDIPNEPLRDFRLKTARRGRLIFTAIRNITDTSGIYDYHDGRIRSLIAIETALPGGFGDGSRVRYLDSYGTTLWFEKEKPSVPPQYGLMVRRQAGEIRLLIQTNDEIPGTNERYLKSLSATGTRDQFLVNALTAAFEERQLTHQNNSMRPLAVPGERLTTGETVMELTSNGHLVQGRLYFRARLTDATQRVLYWENGTLNVLPDTTLEFPEPPPAHFQLKLSPTSLFLGYPDEHEVEFSPHLTPPQWSPLGTHTPIEWPLTEPQAFFRLRKY